MKHCNRIEKKYENRKKDSNEYVDTGMNNAKVNETGFI